MRRLLIVGCGDVAQRALPWLARRFRIYATARDAESAARLRARGVVPVRADLDAPGTLRRLAGLAPFVLHSAPPPERGRSDPRTRRLIAALTRRSARPKRIVYISTSGVYGDCAGALVPEARPARPATDRAQRRVAAERALRKLGRRAVDVCVLRAPGIYAAERLPLERIARGDPVLAPEDDVYTNHIHADDLARIAALALFRAKPSRAYNASDDSELTMGAWFDRVADAFGLAHPPRVERARAGERLSPATLSFMSESRRLVNARMKRELRLRLRYPTVDDGIAAARMHNEEKS